MPDIKLKKSSFNEVLQEFLDWNKDENAKQIYLSLMEQGVEGPAEHLCEACFWAGLWFSKLHGDQVEIDESGANTKPKRPIAPTFV